MSKLHPLSPEVISRQATINIGACSAGSGHTSLQTCTPLACPTPGTIGHVAHGKSTIVKSISGVKVRQARGARRWVLLAQGHCTTD